MPINPTLRRRPRQKEHKFKASIGYIVRLCLILQGQGKREETGPEASSRARL